MILRILRLTLRVVKIGIGLLLKLPSVAAASLSFLFLAAPVGYCNEATDSDPSDLLQEEPYHIVLVDFVRLKERVSEDEDLPDDKTNSQCCHLLKLLAVNESNADDKH